MPELFDFSDIFAEWETDFERIPKTAGHYDYNKGGKWISASGETVGMRGIVVPLSNTDLQFEPGGVFTRDDRKVYVEKPGVLAVDDHIRVNGLVYRVMELRSYEEFANFNIYFAKRVDTKGRDPVA